jgi:hypothetical protein
MKQLFAAISLILVIQQSQAGNPVSVPLGDPIYRFLDRMETIGIIDNLRDGIKPFERGRISQLLIKVNEERTQLSPIDRQRLDNYLLDFRYEIDYTQKYAAKNADRNWYTPFSSWDQFKTDFSRFVQQNQPEEDNHLYLWEDSTRSFYFDLLLGFNYDRRNDDVYRTNQFETYKFRGTFNENLGYQLQVAFYRIKGSEGYRTEDPVLKNSWVNEKDDQVYFDLSGGDLAWSTEYVDFHFAYQPVSWGPGENAQLILSKDVAQYPYFSLAHHWSWGSFTYMHGKLLALANGDSIDGQPVYPDKWIVSNRFEFSPIKSMSVGLTGMILYGNRYLEWSYLLPFIYLRAVEHNLRDRDNALLAVDLEARLWRGIKVYGTFLIDELWTKKLFTDWWGNKHGFQAGTHITDPFGIPNLALRFEYSAIMPWVYTHKYNVNRYINDGVALGNWAGPNSEIIYAHIEKDLHQRLIVGFKYQQWKHGDNYPNENIGGDILVGHNVLLGDQEEPRATRTFLEGILSTNRMYEFYTQYQLFNDFFINLAARKIESQTTEFSQNLTEVHLGFKLEY